MPLNVNSLGLSGEELFLRRVKLPPSLKQRGTLLLKLALTVLNLVPLITVLILSFVERDSHVVCAFRPWTHGYIDCVSIEEVWLHREHRYTSILLGPLSGIIYSPDVRCYTGLLTSDHEFIIEPKGETALPGRSLPGAWSRDLGRYYQFQEFDHGVYCTVDAYAHGNKSLVRFVEVLILFFILSITLFSALNESDAVYHNLLLFIINVTTLGVCLSVSFYVVSHLCYKGVLFVLGKVGKIDPSIELDTLVMHPTKTLPKD